MLEEDTGLRSVGMQRKLPVGGYFAVFRRYFVGLEMMWAVREFQEHEGNDSIDLALVAME